MHHSTNSSNGGIFKGSSIFGGSKTTTPTRSTTRPSTSSGSPATHSESTSSSTTSKTSTGFSRKSSFSSTTKSPKSSHRSRNNSSAIHYYKPFPEKKERPDSVSAHADNHHSPAHARDRPDIKLTTGDSLAQIPAGVEAAQPPPSPAGSFTSTTPYANMLARPGTGYPIIGPHNSPAYVAQQPSNHTAETITYQHIQDTSSKRISTLDYLRKAHEGRVYWFNTLLFNKPDLQRMPYFDSRKLARRATNYLLLGVSIPTIIDLNGSNALEFLKALNALLSEFESFQQIHPPDGSTSISRGRFPQMFKRATTAGSKGRRASSAADIGLPLGSDYLDSKSTNGSTSAGGSNSGALFATSETDLLPGEEYTHLLTPSLPFDPDFYETFATLCDVLIDCYTKLMSLVPSPKDCNPVVAEMFTKADAKVRKVIIQGVVKEFEDSSRSGVKSEVAGVGRVVLGGLM